MFIDFSFQERVVNVVQEGVANAKAAAQAAGDALSDNFDDLKDTACEYFFNRDEFFGCRRLFAFI